MTTAFIRPSDPYRWVWLLVGAVLLTFAALPPVLPVAVWIAPILLLRFARTMPRTWIAIGVIWLAQILAYLLAGATLLSGSFPPLILHLIAVVYGTTFTAGYIADRLLVPRLPAWAATLVFPATVTAADWTLSLLNPFATLGSPAYSQYGNLVLMQLLSVTGLWGITFIMFWLAPVINRWWEHHFSIWPMRGVVSVFAVTLVAVFVFGNARLMLAESTADPVRIAALPAGPRTTPLNPMTDADRAAARPALLKNVDDLLARTEAAAQEGAAIVAWAEGAAWILEEDEALLLTKVSTLAKRYGIYVAMGVITSSAESAYPHLENRAVLIDPHGSVMWNYQEAHPGQSEMMAFPAGPDVVPVINTPHGRLSTVIGYDTDFPALIRQAGRAEVDVLFAPSADIFGLRQVQAAMAVFRAVENGVMLIRPSSNGLTLMADGYGHTVAASDMPGGGNPQIVGVTSHRHLPTLYTQIGDLAAYASVGVVIACVVLAVLRSKPLLVPVGNPVPGPIH